MTLKQLIKKWKFDYINSHFTDENFPAPEKLCTDYKLFHFNKYISSEDIMKEMQKEGYEPANLYELLLWKDWNDKDWVIALGSVVEVDGSRGVPYLGRGGSERLLNLLWFDSGWNGYCRFLGVRNGSQKLESLGSDTHALSPSDTLTKSEIEQWILRNEKVIVLAQIRINEAEKEIEFSNKILPIIRKML